MIHAIWWGKPKDIGTPTRLTEKDATALAALMCNRSVSKATSVMPRASLAWRLKNDGDAGLETVHEISEPLTARSYSAIQDESPWEGTFVCNLSGQTWIAQIRLDDWRRYNPRTVPPVARLVLDCLTLEGLKIASEHTEILQRFESCWREFDEFGWPGKMGARAPDWTHWLGGHDITHPFSRLRDLKAHGYALALTLATALYGGLHMTAWLSVFPNKTELLFWRASSLTVTVSGAFLILLFSLIDLALRSRQALLAKHRDDNSPGLEKITRHPEFCILSIMYHNIRSVGLYLFPTACLWYLICRACLVVQCFISLAHLSPAMLQMPTWSRYVPHIS
jgi:hypothetical protein